MSSPKFCPKCGNPLPENSKFCGKCGARLDDAAAAPMPDAAAPSAAPIPDAAQPAADAVQQPFDPAQQPFDPAQQPYNPAQQPFDPAQQPYDPAQQQAPVDYSGYNAGAYAVPAQGGPTPASEIGKKLGAWIKKHKMILIISAAAIAALVAGLIILFHFLSFQKINAKDLFAVRFKGLNTKGTAVGYLNCSEADPDPYSYEIDENGNSVEKEYSDYFAYDKKTLLKVFDKASDIEQASEMRKALLEKSKGEYDLKLELSKDSELSNGDKVTCKVVYDEDELKDAKIKLENTEFDVEVSGLVDGEELDMFKDFEIKFTGMSERGTVEYNDTNSTYPFINYYISDGSSYNVKNGDVITIEASLRYGRVDNYSYIDNNNPDAGIYFKYDNKTYIVSKSTVTKQFTVSGLSEAQTVDVFENIKIKTSGAVPYLRINGVDTEGVDKVISDNVSFSIDTGDKNSLKSGDTFKVKAYVYNSLLSDGYKPSNDMDEENCCYKEFTVDDTSYGYYLSSESDPKDVEKFDTLTQPMIDDFKEDYTGKSYLSGIKMDGKIKSFDSFTNVSNYLTLFNKFEDGTLNYYDTKSYLFRIYKVAATVTDDDGKDSKKNIFVAFKLTSPYIDGEGAAMLESNYANIYFGEKAQDIITNYVEKVNDTKVVQLGEAAKTDDSSSKKEDDSSKKSDDSSKKDDDSSGKEDDSSKKADDSSKKDDDSSKSTKKVTTKTAEDKEEESGETTTKATTTKKSAEEEG